MEKHAKLLQQFSPGAHFSKMIHTGKKCISLSLGELSVLSIGFYKEVLREGECTHNTHSHLNVHVHTHTHTTESMHEQAPISVDSFPNMELGHT